MDSERQKREQEIERLVRGTAPTGEAERAFQEKIKKAASAILKEEESRIEKTERAERPQRSINPVTVGVWLVVLAAVGFAFSMPGAGAVLLICGIAAMVWPTVLKSRKRQPSRPHKQNQ